MSLPSPRFASKTEKTVNGMISRIAIVMARSSQPSCPPKRGSREIIRMAYAMTARMPPMTPAQETI